MMEILALIVALAGVIAGPFVSYIITRKQIQSATEISKEQLLFPVHQKWVEDFRLLAARMMNEGGSMYHLDDVFLPLEQRQKYLELCWRVRFMLDMNKPMHVELNQIIDKINILCANEQDSRINNPDSFIDLQIKASEKIRQILAEETKAPHSK